MRVIILSLLFLGCSRFPPGTVRDVDPALESSVSAIEQMYSFKVNYPIKFATLPDPVIGRCNKNGVVIDQSYYDYYKDLYPSVIEALLIHEVGHCSFYLIHEDAVAQVPAYMYGCPISIMSSTIDEWCYINNRTYYINEFASRIGRELIQ